MYKRQSIKFRFPVVGWQSGVRVAEVNVGASSQVTANDNSGQTITANVTAIPFSTISRNIKNVWNGTQLTANATARYDLEGIIRFSVPYNEQIRAYVNGSLRKTVGVGGGSTLCTFASFVDLNRGDVLELRTDITRTLVSGTPHLHHISIQEVSNAFANAIVPQETVSVSYTHLTLPTTPYV